MTVQGVGDAWLPIAAHQCYVCREGVRNTAVVLLHMYISDITGRKLMTRLQ